LRAAREKGAVPNPAEEAFRRHYAQVFRYVRRRTPDDHEAEEVTQRIFADAVRGLDDFVPGATPVLAWLYTVAQRRLADRARNLARLSDLDAARLRPAESTDYGPAVADALRVALAALPEGQRQVVVLKLLRGLPFAEIAKRLDASEAACKMRFARGLETLRDALVAEGVEP
jgi:RNA polymerase sigma-70 factor, ECF subfamily